jgi:IS605 OrfB family transposase
LSLLSHLSRKDAGAVEILKRIVSGEYSLCDSQIQNGKKGLMACLSYKYRAEQRKLDPQRVCGIDLGVKVPVVCATNFDSHFVFLGSGEEVWAARSKFRARRRRQQSTKGLYSKTHHWERSEKENNWIQTYYHALTRQVIKFCAQNGCGTIHMEDLSKLREKETSIEHKRIIWVPGKFHRLLAYKAEEAGIKLIKVNPLNSSRRCSDCGHIAPTNRRTQSDFVCEKCGDESKPINADYNAAKNLALASEEVIRKGYRAG